MNLTKNILKAEDRSIFIENHLPFIIKTITKITNRYVSIENDEELSIGLLAFNEAIDRYNDEKGPFLPFAQLVITSRIKSYLQQENKFSQNISLDKLKEDGIFLDNITENPIENTNLLQDEIIMLKEILTEFGFGFEDLIDECPKHKKTRAVAIDISEKVSNDPPLTSFMYEKKRLPVKQISLKYMITEKILKRSKKFIITVIIIFDKNLRNIKLWIRR